MTFSEFAQMLFPYLGEGMSSADYIVFLTSQIMDKTFSDKDSENHPLGKKKDDTLTRIYKGTRELARKDAQIILSHLDKARFVGYLSVLPVDTLDLIRDAFLKGGTTIDDNEIDTCADFFITILEDCAATETKSIKRKVLTGDTKIKTDFNIDSGTAQLSIPDKYRQCVLCTKWKGNSSLARKIKTGVYGTCLMYDRDQISTGGTDCKNYEPKSTTPLLPQIKM